jgi:hypothetical protein
MFSYCPPLSASVAYLEEILPGDVKPLISIASKYAAKSAFSSQQAL